MPEADAAVFTVTRKNSTGAGSLPAIVAEANAVPGEHAIEFAVSGTIELISSLPLITNNLTINGRDSGIVIKGRGYFPLLAFGNGTTNAIANLTLTKGSVRPGNGGAISNAGTLAIERCAVSEHTAASGYGGAIYSSGPLTILASTFAKCGAYAGGAIASSIAQTTAHRHTCCRRSN